MKKYQKYSSELKQEIIDRYLTGESANNLTKEYNLSTEEREKIVLEYENSNKSAKYFCEKYCFNMPNTLYK